MRRSSSRDDRKRIRSGTLTESGKNVAAKSGLDRSLLNASLGLIARLTEYKACQRGIHVRYEPAAYTSQKCARCGYTDSLNRKTQAEFHCQACGHRANADFNAAEVVAARTKRWLKEELRKNIFNSANNRQF